MWYVRLACRAVHVEQFLLRGTSRLLPWDPSLSVCGTCYICSQFLIKHFSIIIRFELARQVGSASACAVVNLMTPEDNTGTQLKMSLCIALSGYSKQLLVLACFCELLQPTLNFHFISVYDLKMSLKLSDSQRVPESTTASEDLLELQIFKAHTQAWWCPPMVLFPRKPKARGSGSHGSKTAWAMW